MSRTPAYSLLENPMKKRFWGAFLSAAAAIAALGSSCPAQDGKIFRGEYLGQAPPGETAELFGAGMVSTGLPELNTAFFPGGKEVIFSVQYGDFRWALVMAREEAGRWRKPEVAPFSGEFGGVDPFVSYDGNRVYFCSNRPLKAGDPVKRDYDIWYVDRAGGSWAEPVRLGAPINTDAHEFYPTLTRSGTMYFGSRRPGGLGQADIYRAELVDGRYDAVECLPEPVNSPGSEGDALIAPDESYIIVSSYRDVPPPGLADLFVSFRSPEGKWSSLVNMGPGVNSPGGENCQILSPCGRYLFFTSRRYSLEKSPATYDGLVRAFNEPLNAYGDSFWVDAGIIQKLRPHARW
jgi:hypothetical protein